MPFQSTGQAVSSTLQEILSSRKAEQRQAMLDDISRRNIESEISNRAENTASMKTFREAQADKDRADSWARRSSTWARGRDLSDLAPADLAEARKYLDVSDTDPNPTPQVSTSETFDPTTVDAAVANAPQPPATPKKTGAFYRGSAKDQERADYTQRTGDLLSSGALSNPDDQEGSDQLRRALMISQATGQPMSAAELANLTKTSGKELIIGPSGKVTVATDPTTGKPFRNPGGNHFNQLPNPPQAPTVQFFTDPKSGVMLGAKRGENALTPTKLPDGVTSALKVGGPQATKKAVPMFSDSVIREINTARTKAMNGANGAKPTKRDVDGFWDSVHSWVNQANITSDPSVKEAVLQVIDSDDQRPAHEIAQELAADPEATKEEVMEFQQMLTTIRGY